MDKRIPDAVIRRAWLDTGLTSAEAAQSVGLSRVRLWVRAKSLGLPARKEGRRPVAPAAELTALWQAGVLVRDIAALYRCPKGSVRQLTRAMGLPGRPRGKHGPISMEQFRADLIRRANSPTDRLTDTERALLQKTRPQ